MSSDSSSSSDSRVRWPETLSPLTFESPLSEPDMRADEYALPVATYARRATSQNANAIEEEEEEAESEVEEEQEEEEAEEEEQL